MKSPWNVMSCHSVLIEIFAHLLRLQLHSLHNFCSFRNVDSPVFHLRVSDKKIYLLNSPNWYILCLLNAENISCHAYITSWLNLTPLLAKCMLHIYCRPNTLTLSCVIGLLPDQFYSPLSHLQHEPSKYLNSWWKEANSTLILFLLLWLLFSITLSQLPVGTHCVVTSVIHQDANHLLVPSLEKNPKSLPSFGK